MLIGTNKWSESGFGSNKPERCVHPPSSLETCLPNGKRGFEMELILVGNLKRENLGFLGKEVMLQFDFYLIHVWAALLCGVLYVFVVVICMLCKHFQMTRSRWSANVSEWSTASPTNGTGGCDRSRQWARRPADLQSCGVALNVKMVRSAEYTWVLCRVWLSNVTVRQVKGQHSEKGDQRQICGSIVDIWC